MKKIFTLAAAVLASFSLWAAEKVLFSTDFSDAIWTDHATICAGETAEETVNGIYFRSNNKDKQYTIADGALTFCDNNSGNNYFMAIPVQNVNGKVIVTLGTVEKSQRVNYLFRETNEISTSGVSMSSTAASINTDKEIKIEYVMTGTGTEALVMLGRQGSGQKTVIKTITISTPVPADHTAATVTGITVNDEALAGFDAATLSYNVELPFGTVDLPVVAATTDNDATVTITQATALPGAATVVCKSQDESNSVTYTINFTVKATASDDTYLSDLQVNGTTVEGFAFNSFNYNVQLGVYEEIKVTATPRDPNAQDVEITVNEEEKVVVIEVVAENGSKMYTYKIFYTRAAATELVEISDDTTWDWAEAGTKAPENTDETFLKRSDWFNFADVLPAPGENFKAASLEGMLQFANRDNNSYAQGHKLRFKTTVAGTVTVVFSNTGTKDTARDLFINNTDTEVGSKNTTKVTVEDFAVEAGEVLIEGKEMLDPIVDNMLRFYKVVFKKKSESTAIDNTEAEVKAVKRIVNGVLVIEKNGVKYNAQGAVVK
ncbi:MAG: hypothetical protein J5902_02720 [Paludibacteraceae bacterium]|nr:hypothetical protein [Paludibacteraceae bacterium]